MRFLLTEDAGGQPPADVRFALRLLLRNRAVTTVAVLSLALGIGANTTVFTLVNAILLQPLMVRDINRLVMIQTTEMRNNTLVTLGGTSRPNFEDLRDQNTVLSGATLMGLLGLLASFGLARFVTSLLFGVTGADPLTFGAVAAMLIAVAVLATYIPARKASRVDPVDALRV